MADDNLERITILLQARDKDLSRSLDRMSRRIAQFTRDGERNTARMQQQVEGHFQRMGQSALTFGRSLATGLAVGAASAALGLLTRNLRQTVTSIASIGDEAQRAGVPVEEFQQWAYVAQQNRVAFDSLVDGFKELNLRADEWIATGAGPAAEAFQRLGFNAIGLARQLEDPSELMLEIFDRLQNFDRAAQIRIADEVFGGTGGERFVQLIEQGRQGLARTMQEARGVGAVMEEEMIARADDLDRRYNELASQVMRFAREYALAVGDFVERVHSALTTDDSERAAMDYNAIADEAERARISLREFAAAAEQAGNSRIAAAIRQIAQAMLTVNDTFGRGEIEGQNMVDLLDRLMVAADTAMGAVSGIDEVTLNNATAVVDGLRAQLATLAEQAAITAAQVAAATITPARQVEGFWDTDESRFSLSQFAPTRSPRPRAAPVEGSGPLAPGGGGGGSQDGYAAAVAEIEARTRALDIEAAALVAAAASNQEYGAAIEYARTRAQLMNDAQAEGRQITPALQAEIDRLAQAYVTAGQNAEEAADSMRRVQEDAERGADAIGSIFDGIVQGGDAARQAITRLLQQMASSAFQRLLMGMTGSGGGGGILSMIGGLLGGKRAGGGGVMAGVPYLVNENTPKSEIFIPSRSGGVLNVAQAKDAMRGGGGAPVINIANYSGQPIEQTGQRSNGDGQREIDLAVGRSIKRGRQDGPLARYNLKPGTLRR